MSILSKLNPLNWVRDLLISDYVGGVVRHALTALGTYLAYVGLGEASVIDGWVEATIKLLTSPEFIGGIVAVFTGAASSVANKKA